MSRPTTRSCGVFLIDDHPVVLQGMAGLIEDEPDMHVCGQAFDEQGALEALAASNPDLVVIDLPVGSDCGIGLIKTLRRRFPDVAVLVVTLRDSASSAERALRAGAQGFLAKQETGERLVPAIRELLRGELYVSEAMSARLLRRLLAEPVPGNLASRLSERERQVFLLLGESLGTRQIAEELELSPKTIEIHRASIMSKLDLKDANALVRYAVHWAASHEDG